MGLQIVREMGGRAIAVISDDAKKQFCLDHGALGAINRKQFSHWGVMPETERLPTTVDQRRARVRKSNLGHPRPAHQPAHRI